MLTGFPSTRTVWGSRGAARRRIAIEGPENLTSKDDPDQAKRRDVTPSDPGARTGSNRPTRRTEESEEPEEPPASGPQVRALAPHAAASAAVTATKTTARTGACGCGFAGLPGGTRGALAEPSRGAPTGGAAGRGKKPRDCTF